MQNSAVGWQSLQTTDNSAFIHTEGGGREYTDLETMWQNIQGKPVYFQPSLQTNNTFYNSHIPTYGYYTGAQQPLSIDVSNLVILGPFTSGGIPPLYGSPYPSETPVAPPCVSVSASNTHEGDRELMKSAPVSSRGRSFRSEKVTSRSRGSSRSRSRSQSPLLKIKSWASASLKKKSPRTKLEKKGQLSRSAVVPRNHQCPPGLVIAPTAILQRPKGSECYNPAGIGRDIHEPWEPASSIVDSHSHPDLVALEAYSRRLSKNSTRKRKKLIVLDLDGVLWNRKGKRVSMQNGARDLIEKCFAIADVGFWTSSTSRNVWAPLEALLTKKQQRKMAFFWDRSMCLKSPSLSLPYATRKPIRKIRKLLPKYKDAEIVFVDDTASKMIDNDPKCVVIQTPDMTFTDTLERINTQFSVLDQE